LIRVRFPEDSEAGENIIVRRSARFSSEEIHRALFPKHGPKRRTVEELKQGIREHLRLRSSFFGGTRRCVFRNV
jgi:hypothetical protein